MDVVIAITIVIIVVTTVVTIAINIMPKMMTNGDYGWKVERLNDEDRLQAIDRKREGDLWWRPDFE